MSNFKPEFPELCLEAAAQLANEAMGKQSDRQILLQLSLRLQNLVNSDFADESIRDNHLGMVWDVVRDLYAPETTSFAVLASATVDLATKLASPSIPAAEIPRLFDLCIALHSASATGCDLRDVPSNHPDLVTFA